jgi:hypothetical protein
MMYPIRDPREYQTERLREAKRQQLIKLALNGRQRPQMWQWFNNKLKENLEWLHFWLIVVP